MPDEGSASDRARDVGAKILNFVLKTRNVVSKAHKNKKFCIKITKKRGICIENDEFCRVMFLVRAAPTRR